MNEAIGLICAAVGAVIAFCGFFAGRMSHAKNEGAFLGEIRTAVQYIREEVAEIKLRLEKADEAMQRDIRRLSDRIDAHERTYHRERPPQAEGRPH